MHPIDVYKLYILLDKLVEAGNTVIIAERNTDLFAAADWVIDLGPGWGIPEVRARKSRPDP